jgi:hypothetical protein
MEELRSRIWDYLFRAGKPQEVAIIAERFEVSSAEIEQAVDHPWFDLQDSLVAIAVR